MSTILKSAPLAPQQGFAFSGDWRAMARRLALVPIRLLMVWQQRIHDREALRLMSESQLKDIGIGSIEALQEAEKPFWRA